MVVNINTAQILKIRYFHKKFLYYGQPLTLFGQQTVQTVRKITPTHSLHWYRPIWLRKILPFFVFFFQFRIIAHRSKKAQEVSYFGTEFSDGLDSSGLDTNLMNGRRRASDWCCSVASCFPRNMFTCQFNSFFSNLIKFLQKRVITNLRSEKVLVGDYQLL